MERGKKGKQQAGKGHRLDDKKRKKLIGKQE